MPVDVGIAVENVCRLVDAVAAGTSGGVLGMIPARHCGWEGLAEAEDAFEVFLGGDEGVEGEFHAFEADDGTAMAFDDGILAVPVGAAEVATDNEATVFDSLHGRDTRSKLGRRKAAAGKSLLPAAAQQWPLLMPRDSGSGLARTMVANDAAAVGPLLIALVGRRECFVCCGRGGDRL